MARFEYKVLHGSPMGGQSLMPWASREMRERVRSLSFESQLNDLAADGWEVISCTTASDGNFLWLIPTATVILRRERLDPPNDPDSRRT